MHNSHQAATEKQGQNSKELRVGSVEDDMDETVTVICAYDFADLSYLGGGLLTAWRVLQIFKLMSFR